MSLFLPSGAALDLDAVDLLRKATLWDSNYENESSARRAIVGGNA